MEESKCLFMPGLQFQIESEMNYLSSQRQLSGHHHEIIDLIVNNNVEKVNNIIQSSSLTPNKTDYDTQK